MNKRKMKYKGFTAQIMEARRLKGSGVHGLPQGYPLDVYYVDEFIEPKGNWMKGPGAFVVPVKPDKGLWFDWTSNDELNTAVVPTVKGCNPITGLQTSGFHLEQYENKCPKHGCDFVGDRFCSECNYKWPDRNYNSQSPLWWDGYRVEDGTVRQFFFTSDQNLDIAPRLIGKENTIPAFGFAFFSSKEMRGMSNRYRGVTLDHASSISFSKSVGGPISPPQPVAASIPPPQSMSASFQEYKSSFSPDFSAETLSRGITIGGSSSSGISEALALREKALLQKTVSEEVQKDIPSKKESIEVSIGAGAKIRQSLNEDPYPLESWKETPDAVMTIYFIFNNEFEELRAKGMRDLSGNQEGMLKGLPVG